MIYYLFQTSRSLLLSAWIYLYQDTVPKALAHSADKSTGGDVETTLPFYRVDDMKKLATCSLPVIKDPMESYFKVELVRIVFF